ncbi:MAG TPA: hypothetical protein VFG45_09730 [Candidatus Nitrosocosmicus sp.]|nr:hypothetical protein [Candidatus Nitrosocosmicus sp.]
MELWTAIKGSTINNPRIFNNRNARLTVLEDTSRDRIIAISPDNMTTAKMLSTITSLRISLSSFEFIFPNSVKIE